MLSDEALALLTRRQGHRRPLPGPVPSYEPIQVLLPDLRSALRWRFRLLWRATHLPSLSELIYGAASWRFRSAGKRNGSARATNNGGAASTASASPTSGPTNYRAAENFWFGHRLVDLFHR